MDRALQLAGGGQALRRNKIKYIAKNKRKVCGGGGSKKIYLRNNQIFKKKTCTLALDFISPSVETLFSF